MPIHVSGFLCERVIQDAKDRVLTAVRMMDRVEVDLPENIDPSTTVVLNYINCAALVVFRSDAAIATKGTWAAIRPSGETNAVDFDIDIKDGTTTHTVVFGLLISPLDMGIWRFTVSVDGTILLTLSLGVLRQKSETV